MLDLLEALPRPAISGVRWTTRDQWHTTLRFLGTVDGPTEADECLREALIPEHPVEAVAGPTVRALGTGVVVVPVGGLDSIARAVIDATAHIGQEPPKRPFVGHLTLARMKRGRGRCPLIGVPVSARWIVNEVELIRSHLSSSGSRYETLETVPLTAPSPRRAG